MPYLFYIQPLLVFIYSLVKAVITRLDIRTGVFVLFECDTRKKKRQGAIHRFWGLFVVGKKKRCDLEGKRKNL